MLLEGKKSMYRPVKIIEVRIWGKLVGTLASRCLVYYAFEYDPDVMHTIERLPEQEYNSPIDISEAMKDM